MGVLIEVDVKPSSVRQALRMIDVGIEYLASAIIDADAILREQKVNLDDVGTMADTPVARIAAFLAMDSSIEELREMFEEICNAAENNLPSPDDFEEVDKSEE